MNDAPKRRSRVQQEQPVERTGSHRSRRSRGGRKNGKALYYAVLVILVGVLVFSSVKIISYLKEQKDTERINDNINQDFISPDDTAGDTDTDGDGTDGDSQETQKPVKKDEESIKVDFTAMQAKYPDVVGYVYSANTTLQLPIVQSADEGGEYYLYRDIDGKDNKNGTVRDFVAVGDVEIKVIGGEAPILDSETPVRQILEQLVAKTGLPPFLLGLNWSTTERMSTQQADLLTSELWALRRTVEPAMRKICQTYLALEGLDNRVEIEWDDISLQDITQEAQAALYRAQAEKCLADASQNENS